MWQKNDYYRINCSCHSIPQIRTLHCRNQTCHFWDRLCSNLCEASNYERVIEMNIHELFPRLSEVYTENGIDMIEEVAELIEKMAKDLTPAEIANFLSFVNGNLRLFFEMFYHIQERKG
jgi:hypothetical protein